jgi:hypothetical protein
MSKDRFISPVFAGGTRDTVVGTSINGYAIGEWADKVDEQINLLQEQVQKVSLGFPASVPNIKDLGDIKIDSITKDISHDIVIDPNPPKLYDEIFPVDDIAKHLTYYAEVLHRDIQACSDPVAKHGVIDELAEVNGLLQKLRGVQDRGI